MTSAVDSVFNIFNTSSPFLLTGTGSAEDSSSVVATVLNPTAVTQDVLNIAYSFSPSASIAKLAHPAASVLLAVQTSDYAPNISSSKGVTSPPTSLPVESKTSVPSSPPAPHTPEKPVAYTVSRPVHSDISAAIRAFGKSSSLSGASHGKGHAVPALGLDA